MKTITAILITLIFNSCSCEYLLNRVEKRCGTVNRTDTVKTTITTTLTTRDTLFKVTHHKQTDTVIIKKNELIYKYFYNTKDSTIYLDGKCDPQIIRVDVPVTYKQFVYNVWGQYKKYIIFFIFCVALYYVIIFINRLTKPKI